MHGIIGGTSDWGEVSCDFRGHPDDFLSEQHRTIFEHDFGPDVQTNADIEAVLEAGPEINAAFSKLRALGVKASGPLGALMGLEGNEIGMRIGVWNQ